MVKMTKTIEVRVIPNAKINEVRQEEGRLKVHLCAKPVGNRANMLLIKLLAEHFGVKKSQVSIIKGAKSGEKVVMVGE